MISEQRSRSNYWYDNIRAVNIRSINILKLWIIVSSRYISKCVISASFSLLLVMLFW